MWLLPATDLPLVQEALDSLVGMKSLNEASSFWVYTVGVELRYIFIACSSSLQQALSLQLCWNGFHPSSLHLHSLLNSTKSQRREIISCVAPGSYRHTCYYVLHACSSVADHTYSTGQLAKNSRDLTNEFHSLATNIWLNSAWYGMQGIWWRLGMLQWYVEQKSLAFQIPVQWFITPPTPNMFLVLKSRYFLNACRVAGSNCTSAQSPFAFVCKNLTKNFTISGVFLFIAELLPPHSQ